MDPANLGKELAAQQKRLSLALAAFRRATALLGRADMEPTEVRQHLETVRTQLEEASAANLRPVLDWVAEQLAPVASAEEAKRRRFGVELEALLAEQGIRLEGTLPKLRAGLFTIEVGGGAKTATLWYGPEQERLGTSKTTPTAVADAVRSAQQKLGSGLPEEELFALLRRAYARATVDATQRMPIMAVLPELAHLLQSDRYRNDPRREHHRDYTRADFSYDLFRLRSQPGLRLTVAVKEFTRNRATHLWIPDDLSGRGTAYSHLEVK